MLGELVRFTSDLERDDCCCCCDVMEESHKSESSFMAESGRTDDDEEEKHLLVPEAISSVSVGIVDPDDSTSAERGVFNLHEVVVTLFAKLVA